MHKIIFLFLLFSMQLFSQSKLKNLIEELPNDSIETLSLSNHTAIFPMMINCNENNSVKANALFDGFLNAIQMDQYRIGGGLQLEGFLNNKWHLKFGNIISYNSDASQFRPNSFTDKTITNGTISNDFRGRLSFTPNPMFNFQVGLDHNFIGEGNRSLFLSDYGKPYTFGQIRLKFWRIEYSVLYQFFREKTVLNQWSQKNAASHYLSFNATKWLNFGLFETVVFQPKDTLLNRGYELEYLNPVVFYRPQEYALGSSDNVLIGLSCSAKFKKHMFYSQLIIDEFLLKEITSNSGWWGNKYGIQVGIKGRFSSKWGNFFYRTEYNLVRPYTYAHIGSGQNYGNQGSTLSHPYGANFKELLFEFKFQRKRLLIKTFFNFSIKGLDTSLQNSFGGDIYASYLNRPDDYGNIIGQGAQNKQIRGLISIAYCVHNPTNLQLFIESSITRSFQFNLLNQAYILVGFRSQLWNDYRNY